MNYTIPLVSVIVTTKNEERNIEHCIKSIKLQSYENIEIIVVDNFSTDKTKEIALKYTNKVYDKGPERSAQRNFGMIDIANGKYVMFIDADMILAPCLVESCVKEMEKDWQTSDLQPPTSSLSPPTSPLQPLTSPLKPTTVALHIPEIVLGKKYFSKVRRFERSFYDGTVIDGARFFLKEAFVKVGGFDESMSGPEDWDIDKKIKQIGKIELLNHVGANCNSPDWELYGFIKERGVDPKDYGVVIYHNEAEFNFKKYFSKKGYYAQTMDVYINKWGKNDKDVKKQFGLYYRFLGVFIEKGKWVRSLLHPVLVLGIFVLRFSVGLQYLAIKCNKSNGGYKLDKYSKKYIHYYTDEIPSLIKDIFNKHNVNNIADLGSGDGSILYSLSKKGWLDNVEKVVAVDISKERINNVKKINDKILYVVGDICNLGLVNDINLDMIISTQVIEHVSDDSKFIEEAYRVLDKKGIFYLSTVFKKWYGWYFYRYNGKWVLDPTHLREYTNENQLLDIIKKYNFEILENKKTLQWFPITDFIFKRIAMNRNIYDKRILKLFRNIRVPIFGYYNWEIVLKKNKRSFIWD